MKKWKRFGESQNQTLFNDKSLRASSNHRDDSVATWPIQKKFLLLWFDHFWFGVVFGPWFILSHPKGYFHNFHCMSLTIIKNLFGYGSANLKIIASRTWWKSESESKWLSVLSGTWSLQTVIQLVVQLDNFSLCDKHQSGDHHQPRYHRPMAAMCSCFLWVKKIFIPVFLCAKNVPSVSVQLRSTRVS